MFLLPSRCGKNNEKKKKRGRVLVQVQGEGKCGSNDLLAAGYRCGDKQIGQSADDR